jgi:hypothetical protein
MSANESVANTVKRLWHCLVRVVRRVTPAHFPPRFRPLLMLPRPQVNVLVVSRLDVFADYLSLRWKSRHIGPSAPRSKCCQENFRGYVF